MTEQCLDVFIDVITCLIECGAGGDVAGVVDVSEVTVHSLHVDVEVGSKSTQITFVVERNESVVCQVALPPGVYPIVDEFRERHVRATGNFVICRGISEVFDYVRAKFVL